MSREKAELTTSETAARLGVKAVTVRKWLAENLFPNARREDTPRGAVWYIPASDVDGFVQPTRGRPLKDKKDKKDKNGEKDKNGKKLS